MQSDENANDSALRVMQGIEQPSAVSDEAVRKLRNRKKSVLPASEYVDGILRGDRILLSKAITLVESHLPAHQEIAQQIIQQCLPHSGRSLRIGITGVPGAGKSSFIETFGTFLTGIGRSVAVLAVDPSSERSKGSILGDKTRMEKLSQDANAYIRPSPSAGSLGGVARKTREIIVLVEAAGFDTVIVETVGVGQSETVVHSMVDFFLLLLIAGGGDELQGIKRGIIEMSDAIVINKADGDNVEKAKLAMRQYAAALHLYPRMESDWVPATGICSAMTGFGIDTVWELIADYERLTRGNGYFERHRSEQSVQGMMQSIKDSLGEMFFQHTEIKQVLQLMQEKVLQSEVSPYTAAAELIRLWIEKLQSGKV